jgi:prepilin-type N-terminal cleavage/methylation domain-containing protein
MPTLSVGRINSAKGAARTPQPIQELIAPHSVLREFLGKRRRRLSNSESGVTLLELLIVMVIIAVIAAVSYPTASAGLDGLRLRSAADRVMALLNLALDRADRVQQVVEIRVSPEENAISARSMDLSLNRTLALDQPIRIASVSQATAVPAPPGVSSDGASPAGVSPGSDAAPIEQRRFLLYPGGTPPRIIIELESREGRKRRVIVEPITGMLHSEAEHQ